MAAWGMVQALAGCVTSISNEPDPSSTVERSSVLNVARTIEMQGANRQAGVGGGDSMAPIFGDNTVLVIAPIAFEDLEKDMMVAYRNTQGHRVVHRLAMKRGQVWMAIGINNRDFDPEPVTRANLLGVVYAVLNSEALED